MGEEYIDWFNDSDVGYCDYDYEEQKVLEDEEIETI
jgi:hypothetical protein